MPVITFASFKGGSGKTTSAIILATTIARFNQVQLIDADPAQRLTPWAEKASLPKNLSLIPMTEDSDIRQLIATGIQRADVTIIDVESTNTPNTTRAIAESDLVIVPMGDDRPDAEGAIETLETIALETGIVGRDIPARILFTRAEAGMKSRLAKGLNSEVRAKFPTFKTELHRRSAFSNLHDLGGTLYDLNSSEVNRTKEAIENAEAFVEEVFQIFRHPLGREVIQTTVRLPRREYERFCALCETERRSRGDMLVQMMAAYQDRQPYLS